MKDPIRVLVIILATLSLACGEYLIAPDVTEKPNQTRAAASSNANEIAVLNWNLYIGANVDAVIEALANGDPTDDLDALLSAVETLQETDVVTRLEAVARTIAHIRPHVVGLQEVTVLDIDLTALGLPVDIEVDFLPILLAALAAEGVNYTSAVVNQNIDANPLLGVRVVDFDALLVDASRVTVDDAATKAETYTANIGVVAPGVNILRGWVSIEATIDGSPYTFVNTHLEPASGGDLRAAQVAELLQALGGTSPLVVMGDLNDGPGSPMHQLLTGAGLTDLWPAFHPGAAGLTCCHLPNLSNRLPDFHQRIDYIMTRGIGHPITGVLGQVERLGEVPADRLSGPVHSIWPSDHVGLVARLRMPPAVGIAAGGQ